MREQSSTVIQALSKTYIFEIALFYEHQERNFTMVLIVTKINTTTTQEHKHVSSNRHAKPWSKGKQQTCYFEAERSSKQLMSESKESRICQQKSDSCSLMEI